jgi:hypothetical protein
METDKLIETLRELAFDATSSNSDVLHEAADRLEEYFRALAGPPAEDNPVYLITRIKPLDRTRHHYWLMGQSDV